MSTKLYNQLLAGLRRSDVPLSVRSVTDAELQATAKVLAAALTPTKAKPAPKPVQRPLIGFVAGSASKYD